MIDVRSCITRAIRLILCFREAAQPHLHFCIRVQVQLSCERGSVLGVSGVIYRETRVIVVEPFVCEQKHKNELLVVERGTGTLICMKKVCKARKCALRSIFTVYTEVTKRAGCASETITVAV